MNKRESLGRGWLTAAAVGMLGAALYQATFVIAPVDHLYSDMRGYIERAWRLSLGVEVEAFDVFYPMGTAYAYALLFSSFGFARGLVAITGAQALAIAGNLVLAVLLAETLYRSRFAAVVALIGTFAYWPFAAQASFYLAEPFFSFLLLLSLLLTARGCGQPGRLTMLPLAAGLAAGAACLFKGQGLAVVAAEALALLLFSQQHRRFHTALYLLAAGFPILLQMGVNSLVLGEIAPFLAANDAYNAFLGQSRREGLGCMDLAANYFYVFHNNNAGLPFRFRSPIVLPVSILDRAYFQSELRELWRTAPFQQVIISLQNVVELFAVNPRWPLRNLGWTAPIEVNFQWVFVALTTVPSCYTLLDATRRRRFRLAVLLFAGPIALLALLCAVTMGQPRYLLPFQYLFVLLAAPFYVDLFRKRTVTIAEATPSKALAVATLVLLAAFLCASGTLLYRAIASTGTPARQSVASPIETKRPLMEVELGRERQLVTWRHGADHFQLELRGFDPHYTGLADPWALQADNGGWMRIDFPQPGAALEPREVRLYLTDTTPNIRTVAIETSEHRAIVETFAPGTWIAVPIDALSRKRGHITIQLRTFTGPGVQVARIAVYD
ncbi:MAG: hypothetical protein KDD69_09730 [Bdellovibrionales bacterium]|nr:hypothetical protein [Bdellovibrionales bacterium]